LLLSLTHINVKENDAEADNGKDAEYTIEDFLDW
jgi:hypothetical protein